MYLRCMYVFVPAVSGFFYFFLRIVGWTTCLAEMLPREAKYVVYLTNKWLSIKNDLRNPHTLILQIKLRPRKAKNFAKASQLMNAKHRLESRMPWFSFDTLSNLPDHPP